MLIPVVGGIAILTGTAAFGTLVVYNQQWIMSKEYQADDCGYQILEKIHPGAYFRGMEETNTFHIDHAKERLSGEALKKKLEILKKHLALKQAKLKATHKIA